VDTRLSDLVCLKRRRANEAVGAVSAGSVVIYFDEFEYWLPHFLSGGEPLTINGFNFERVDNALGTGIVWMEMHIN